MHQSSLRCISAARNTCRAPHYQWRTTTVQAFHSSANGLDSEPGRPSSSHAPPRSKSSASATAFRQIQAYRPDGTGNRQGDGKPFHNNYRRDGRGGFSGNREMSRTQNQNGDGRRTPSFTRGGTDGYRGGRQGDDRRSISGRGGRGRGRGPPRNTRRRPRRTEGHEESTEMDRELEVIENNFANLQAEGNKEHFHSEQEITNYAQLADFLDEFVSIENRIEKLGIEAQALPEKSPEYISKASEMAALREFADEGIQDALQFIVLSENEARPHHNPTEVPMFEYDAHVGGIPTGSNSTGNIMEEALRYLANREKQEWVDPKKLAERLVAGDLIKFRDPTEKRKVMRLAEHLAYKADAPKGETQVGFEPPSPAARKVLVQRLVKGQYTDAKDADITQDVLKNVARITGGNHTYRNEKRSTLLKTIEALLPGATPSAQQQQQQTRR